MASVTFDRWALTNLRLVDRAGDLIPFRLRPPQQVLHARLERQRQQTGRVRALILKARREGVSTYVAGRFYHHAVTTPNLNVTVMAHLEESAQELFRITETFYHNTPDGVRPPLAGHARLHELHFDDRARRGSLNSRYVVRVPGQSAARAKGTGRGATLHRVHCSEVAFWAEGALTATALLQAAEGDGTEVVMESTANGMAGYFYETWMNSQDNPHSDWLCVFLPWWIDPHNAVRLTPDEKQNVGVGIDDYEREMLTEGFLFEGNRYVLTPEQVVWRRRKLHTDFSGDVTAFQQEYPASPGEAFIASGSCYFDLDSLAQIERKIVSSPKPERVRLSNDGWGITNIRPQVDPQGEVSVWHRPEPDRVYVIGADAAYGLGRRAQHGSVREGQTPHDANAAYVVDVTDPDALRVVAAYWGFADPDLHAADLWCLGHWYNEALIAVESNGPGQAVLDGLRVGCSGRVGYRQLLRQVQMADRSRRMGNRVGFYTSKDSRDTILSLLKAAVRDGTLDLKDGGFVREARSFLNIPDHSGTIKPQAMSGAHDDRVMALAIALWAARYGKRTMPVGDDDWDSFMDDQLDTTYWG